MERVFTWTTPDQAERDELAYWLSRPPIERLSAVELLREVTIGIYTTDEVTAPGGIDGSPMEAPRRLERVHRLVERA